VQPPIMSFGGVHVVSWIMVVTHRAGVLEIEREAVGPTLALRGGYHE
jgi:hypothetical protein